MIKRFFLALAVVGGLLSPALAAGTITMSLTQRLDNSTHLPLAGGKMYFIQAGTTSTPQNAYQDSALTIPYPNPLTLDSGGNIPQLFFADGVIKVRITNSAGIQQLVQDNIQVTGASSGGGGGGGTVDPTTIMQTGHMELFYGAGVLTGFVRCNGRTIGSAVSGASERANADTSALFAYLWGADPNLTVSGGRGASAAADFAANKMLTLPDCRGRVIAGLADMGNTAASWLTSTYFGATPTTLGAVSTTTDHTTLATANLPPYTPSGTVATTTSGTLPTQGFAQTGSIVTTAISFGSNSGGLNPLAFSMLSSSTFNGGAQGGTSTPFSNIPPMILTTVYLKL